VLGEVLTAIVTPFDRDGRADLDRFRELAQFLVDNGSDGIVVCGTTGESPTLSDAEKIELWETAVDVLRGRATVVAGTGTNDTAHSIDLTKKATEIGVDGLLVVTPYYNKPPTTSFIRFSSSAGSAASVFTRTSWGRRSRRWSAPSMRETTLAPRRSTSSSRPRTSC
jgi:4-hydroxy-tetrahydrodipicolinate synthase